jgi:hypothetical protein
MLNGQDVTVALRCFQALRCVQLVQLTEFLWLKYLSSSNDQHLYSANIVVRITTVSITVSILCGLLIILIIFGEGFPLCSPHKLNNIL